MESTTQMNKQEPVERRRFLRESLRGSVPLLFSWMAGRASALARLAQDSSSPRRPSPPPAATKSAPARVKENLAKRGKESARDNPASPDSFSS